MKNFITVILSLSLIVLSSCEEDLSQPINYRVKYIASCEHGCNSYFYNHNRNETYHHVKKERTLNFTYDTFYDQIVVEAGIYNHEMNGEMSLTVMINGDTVLYARNDGGQDVEFTVGPKVIDARQHQRQQTRL